MMAIRTDPYLTGTTLASVTQPQAGLAVSSTANPGVTPGDADVAVDLSASAQLVSNLLPLQPSSSLSDDDSDGGELDAFMQDLKQQIQSQGKDAGVLGELPNKATPGRTELAKQAANYLLVNFYGDSSRYSDASSKNPFADLDGDSLSRIARDDSGAFTPAERQVAYFEMAGRSTDDQNAAFSVVTAPQRQGRGRALDLGAVRYPGFRNCRDGEPGFAHLAAGPGNHPATRSGESARRRLGLPGR
ncbi:hypothetical protein Q3H58_004265 [Pseudomonas psychrotolerans]|nr:hypothetical protein [Pseudomonas psychrotolerans]